MTYCSTTPTQRESFVAEMVQQMTLIAQQVSTWVTTEPRTLAEIEKQTLAMVKDLGNALVTGLVNLTVPAYPDATTPCSCGHTARYERLRPTHVDTLVGTVRLRRPYYLCDHCHHGQAPFDHQMGFCPGGLSAGLDEALALLGGQFPFDQATDILQRLTLSDVCANTVKSSTDNLGQAIATDEQHAVAAAWDLKNPTLPPLPDTIPDRLYVSMDGMLLHTHEEGWKEMRLGTVYTTIETPAAQRPEQVTIRACAASYYADFADPASFGRALWVEAYRRGVSQAKEVIAIGDGAHWIWDLVQEHFPTALEIVDWYHAASYIWTVAHALYGEGTAPARSWAQPYLDDLWDGKVSCVVAHLQDYLTHASAGEAAHKAITYYSNNKERMNYPLYRAKGIQIGSGSIESGCKHVLGARLKQAGMIWTINGARAVAKVRTRLKSGRWDETIAHSPPPQRHPYTRQAA